MFCAIADLLNRNQIQEKQHSSLNRMMMFTPRLRMVLVLEAATNTCLFLFVLSFIIKSYFCIIIRGATPRGRRNSCPGFAFRLDERAEKRKEVRMNIFFLFLLFVRDSRCRKHYVSCPLMAVLFEARRENPGKGS